MATMTADQLLEAFEKMTVLELSEFKKTFEDKFGVTAAAPVAMAAAPAAGGGLPPRQPRLPRSRREFTATITEIGPNKIPVIKVVRELTGLGLKEAKDLVDATPEGRQGRHRPRRGREDQGGPRRAGRQGRDQVSTVPGRPGPGVVAGAAGAARTPRVQARSRARAPPSPRPPGTRARSVGRPSVALSNIDRITGRCGPTARTGSPTGPRVGASNERQ